jgi:preprotein translocase subunit SecG
MNTVVLVLHLLIALSLIALVLMQRSEGGALGIGGGTSSLISGRGAADLLARITGILAALFFVTSISLTLLSGGERLKSSVIDEPAQSSNWFDMFLPKKTAPVTPAAPSAPTSDLSAPAATAPPSGDVAPAPNEAVQHAGPIDSAPLPLAPSPAAKPAAPAPKPVVTAPKPKPAVAAATAPAESVKPKPVVGGTKPAPAPAPESVEPAAPAGRAGPDE